MIVDKEKYDRTSRGSAQKILCQCDDCGGHKMAIKQNISRMVGGTYTLCWACRMRVNGKNLIGIKRSGEHRRKTGLASKGRVPSARHLAVARARFTGESNPNWNQDRDAVKRNELARKEIYSLIHGTLKRLGTSKVGKTVDLLGYTADDLRRHIDALLKPGMTWDNRSAWHIDHIKPIAAFIAEGINDPAIINALANLQPLWASENCSKRQQWCA